ncbi:MAG TPA: hypothetical protein ENJ53_04155 [Phaeodactylibacter sp.]|nr:hypothetical protein [Phaeodactylibacter sp.]
MSFLFDEVAKVQITNENIKRTADGGRRTADGGRRTADDGRQTADGRRLRRTMTQVFLHFTP